MERAVSSLDGRSVVGLVIDDGLWNGKGGWKCFLGREGMDDLFVMGVEVAVALVGMGRLRDRTQSMH